MSGPFLESVDVFLPGRGEELMQSPDYDWERIGEIQGWFYRNTRGTGEIRIQLKRGSEKERAMIYGTDVDLPPNTLWMHDFKGMFGIHTPGLLVTSKGTAIATCGRRHDSMSDGGHDGDIVFSRSEDGGKTWSRQACIYAEAGMLLYIGAIFEDRDSGSIFVSFWKIPSAVIDDTGYFKTHAAQGGGFLVLKSTDEGKTWSDPVPVTPAPNKDGWVAWNNNCVHGIQLRGGSNAGRIIIPAFFFKTVSPDTSRGSVAACC